MTLRNILLSSFFLLLLACVKEEKAGGDSPVSEEYGYMEFRVEAESTRSELESLSIRFEKGDAIAIWDGVKLRRFEACEVEGNIVFRGKAVETDTYWALYPWSEDCLVTPVEDVPVFKTSVPDVQAAREGSFALGSNVGIGKGGSDHVICMKNVCGFLKFTLPEATVPTLAPGSMNSVKLTSSAGVKLSGDFSVSLGTDGEPVVTPSESIEADRSVSVVFDDVLPKAGGVYCYCVLPCDLSGGIRVDFTRAADKAVATKLSGTKPNKVQRNYIMDLKTLSPDWTPADGEAPDDITTDPSGSFDYESLGASSHPRLLLCDEDFRRLNALLADGSYPDLTERHGLTIAYADKLVGAEIPTLAHITAEYPSFNIQKNRHLSLLARPTLGHLFTCAYAYRTTGQEKYLEKCRRVLSQTCADDDWYPRSFLSTAEIALGVSIAYDWLYYDLTEEERTTIRQCLLTKALDARSESTLTPVNNTGQVHNAGLLAAAIVCYEKDKTRCSALIEESITNILSSVPQIYGPKGSYFEGYGYWSYGTNFQCMYNEMLLTAFGTDKELYDHQGFRNSGEYRLFMADRISTFAYGDGGRSTPGASPAMWVYAARYQNPSLLYNELSMDKNDWGDRMAPMVPCVLSKYARIDTGFASSPAESVWVDSNDAICPVIMVRKGWNGDDSDVYLGLKGGKARVNHGHMDAGTFVYHAQGAVWSTDVPQKSYATYSEAGLSGRKQESSLWKALVYSSLGHSTMSFANYADGFLESYVSSAKVHPTDHIVDGKATIIDSWTSGDELGGRLDLTPLYKYQAESVKRKAVVLKDGSLKIEDEITARSSGDAKLIWRMVTPADAAVDGDRIMLYQSGKMMSFTTSCTSGSISDLTLHDWDSFQSSRPLDGQWGWNEVPDWNESHPGYNVVGFTLTVPKGTKVVMTTLLESVASADSNVSVGFDNLAKGEDFKW